MDINLPLTEVVKPYLKENETVLWADKPAKRFIYLPSDLFSILIGGFWVIFSIFWLSLTIKPAIEVGTGSELLLPYLSIPFFVIGLWFIVIKNLANAIKRKYIIYAITNKRVLTIYQNKGYMEQYQYTDIACAEVRENNDGTGSVFFFSSKSTDKKYSTSGIFVISDIKNVSEIIFKKVRKK